MRWFKQPILAALTQAKEILYELESVRKDLMRLSWTVTSQKILNPRAAVLCNWGQVKEFEELKKLSTYLKRQSQASLYLVFMLAKKTQASKQNLPLRGGLLLK